MSRLLAIFALVLTAATGCRMCASPFDYCGPVVDDCCGCSAYNPGAPYRGDYGPGGPDMMMDGQVIHEGPRMDSTPMHGGTTYDQVHGQPMMRGQQQMPSRQPMRQQPMMQGPPMERSAPMPGPQAMQNSRTMSRQQMQPSSQPASQYRQSRAMQPHYTQPDYRQSQQRQSYGRGQSMSGQPTPARGPDPTEAMGTPYMSRRPRNFFEALVY